MWKKPKKVFKSLTRPDWTYFYVGKLERRPAVRVSGVGDPGSSIQQENVNASPVDLFFIPGLLYIQEFTSTGL